MKPLEPLADASQLSSLLASGEPSAAREAIERLATGAPEAGLVAAAVGFARATLALREGNLDAAREGFDSSAAMFDAAGESEAAGFARVDAAVARTRRGRRELALEALAITEPLVESQLSTELRARALVARGTAYRVIGDASLAQATFARAVALSVSVPEVRSAALNSLGTLCVTLGAYGAAESLCEHAAELCRLRRDTIGEAIAMGQLGAAALGRGDSAAARRYLSRQEWLSSQVNDAFGRTRALVWLAELALDAGRADDALELTDKALASARSVTPPLTTFAAYAERVAGRARLILGDRTGLRSLESARETFAAQRLPLGEALSARDLALASDPPNHEAALASVSVLASLGLPERVSETMRELGASPRVELALAAVSPRRLEPLEARLVHEVLQALADLASDRAASRRNLGRLAVLALSPPGLVVIALRARVAPERMLDQVELGAAALGTLPGVVLFGWSTSASPTSIAADLAALARATSAPLSAVATGAPSARVLGPGFGGGLGAQLEGLDAVSLLAALPAAAESGAACLALDDAPASRPLLEGLAARATELGWSLSNVTIATGAPHAP
ncbi:MAG: hypothetical protein U0271_37240 [Polyangiaceae bacterium]